MVQWFLVTDQSNGFLADVLISAAGNPNHKSHDDAKSYLAKFRSLEDTFFRDVHPQVDVGLAMREVQMAGHGKPNIFTIHGCRHITDLIQSLDKLAKAIELPREPLSVLEAYVLLCAAHLHDVGNVKQREGHPDRCSELMAAHRGLFVSAATVMEQIYQVASVHGGQNVSFGKDTIRTLDLDNSEQPRVPMLAAMLRIGDELSENLERVPELVAKYHDHSDESKLAFAYARSFQKFELRKDNFYLNFGVYPDAAELRVTIAGKEVAFFDFLECKLDVIDREARYCSQYGLPDFQIGRVNVTIRVFERSVPSPVRSTLNFGWSLHAGYPKESESICQRSPDLKKTGAKTLTECIQPLAVTKQSPAATFPAVAKQNLGTMLLEWMFGPPKQQQ